MSKHKNSESINAGNPTYRAAAAAKYISVSKSTLWRYVKAGLLHPTKISDRVTIFTKEDLDNLIAGV